MRINRIIVNVRMLLNNLVPRFTLLLRELTLVATGHLEMWAQGR